MSEYQPVSVESAMQIADQFDKDIVVIVAIDNLHDRTHYVSYGRQPLHKTQAAALSEFIAVKLGHNPQERIEFADFRHKTEAEWASEKDQLLREVADLRQQLNQQGEA